MLLSKYNKITSTNWICLCHDAATAFERRSKERGDTGGFSQSTVFNKQTKGTTVLGETHKAQLDVQDPTRKHGADNTLNTWLNEGNWLDTPGINQLIRSRNRKKSNMGISHIHTWGKSRSMGAHGEQSTHRQSIFLTV